MAWVQGSFTEYVKEHFKNEPFCLVHGQFALPTPGSLLQVHYVPSRCARLRPPQTKPKVGNPLTQATLAA